MPTRQAIKNKLFQINPILLIVIPKLAGKGKKERCVKPDYYKDLSPFFLSKQENTKVKFIVSWKHNFFRVCIQNSSLMNLGTIPLWNQWSLLSTGPFNTCINNLLSRLEHAFLKCEDESAWEEFQTLWRQEQNSKWVSETKGMIEQQDEILQEQGHTMFRKSNSPVQNQKFPFRK